MLVQTKFSHTYRYFLASRYKRSHANSSMSIWNSNLGLLNVLASKVQLSHRRSRISVLVGVRWQNPQMIGGTGCFWDPTPKTPFFRIWTVGCTNSCEGEGNWTDSISGQSTHLKCHLFYFTPPMLMGDKGSFPRCFQERLMDYGFLISLSLMPAKHHPGSVWLRCASVNLCRLNPTFVNREWHI